MQDVDWDDLRFVLAVARGRSLAGAARRLRVNESTVGRRVARVEQRLGARLFERIAGSLTPTEAGCRVIAGAERVELELQAVAGAVAGTDRLAAGTVRLTAVPIVVNRILVPALPSLLSAHPDLEVELIAERRDLSLTRREADIALRLARPEEELRILARRVGGLDYGVYGAAGRRAADLPWITYEDRMADLPQWRWIAAQALEDGQGLSPLKVNDAEALFQGVKAGLGRSLLPVLLAESEPGLARLDRGRPALTRDLWLLVHPELRDLVRIRVTLDWLQAVFDRRDTGG